MAEFAGYFFESPMQLLAFAATALVWLGFASLGGAVAGRTRLREADPLVGWSLVSLLMTAGGTLFGIPFTPLAVVAGIAALAGAAWRIRRDGRLLDGAFVRVALLALPVFVLVSAMAASQWDEFSDWLMIPRYMLATDRFPSADNLFPHASFAAYPYGWHYVTYLASRVAGGLLENAGALMNLMLLLGFGVVLARLIAEGAGRPALAGRPPWWLLASGALFATLLNVTFVQKIVFTSYAETASAVATAVALLLGWRMVEALAAGERDKARTLAWQAGLVLMLLVNLKQATFVLFVLVAVAVLAVGLRTPRVRAGELARLAPVLVVPALVVYVIWRYYVSAALVGHEFSIRPVEDWHLDLLPQILATMASVLAHKGAYLAIVVLLAAFGVRGLIRGATPFDRLAAIAALVVGGYNAFLLFAYVASFGPNDAARAASYWRYNMHVGLVAMAFAVYGGACLWRRRLAGGTWEARLGRLAWLPVVAFVAAQVALAPKVRFDTEPMTVLYRDASRYAAETAEPGDRLFVIDPKGSGEAGVIAAYAVALKAEFAGYLSAYFQQDAAVIGERLRSTAPTLVLVHSVTPAVETVLGLDLQPGHSYLLQPEAGGDGWEQVNIWPHPDGR